MSFRLGHQITCGEFALQICRLVFESRDILFSSKVSLIRFPPGFLDRQHKQKKGYRSLAHGYFSFRSVFSFSHTPAALKCEPSHRKAHMPAILKAKRGMKKKLQPQSIRSSRPWRRVKKEQKRFISAKSLRSTAKRKGKSFVLSVMVDHCAAKLQGNCRRSVKVQPGRESLLSPYHKKNSTFYL